MIVGIGTKIRKVEYNPEYVHTTKEEVSHNIKMEKQPWNNMEVIIMGSNGYYSGSHNQCKVRGMQVFKVGKKRGDK